jgi:hypothetical protein
MEGNAQISRQRTGKFQIAVSLIAAHAVVQMGGVEYQAQLPALLRKGAQQGYGVGAAGEADSQTESRPERRHFDGQPGAHLKMISR